MYMFSHHDIVLAYQYDDGVVEGLYIWLDFFVSVVLSNDYNCATFQIKHAIYKDYSWRLELS